MACRKPTVAVAVSAYEADLLHLKPPPRTLIPWQGDSDVKLDRFDVLHLISSLPPITHQKSSDYSSPSDEDAFDLSGDELHEHEQKRRRDKLMSLRAARVASKAVQERSAPIPTQHHPRPAPVEENVSHDHTDKTNEKPSPIIKQLMMHTAKALLASPEPAILEMKIMANHAADERFAFLRGRYPRAWADIYLSKRHAVIGPTPVPKRMPAGLDLGYGSSDDDGDGSARSASAPPAPDDPPPVLPTPPPDDI